MSHKLALLAALLALCLGHAFAGNYAADGPCGGQRLQQLAIMPMSTGCKLVECAVKMIISRPDPAKAGAGGCPKGPYPVVFMFNGFSTRAGWYFTYANRLASYGYVVVQYNLQAVITPDAQELGYLVPVKKFLVEQNKKEGGPLFGAIDFAKQATVGHSRGGKLAALHMAQEPSVYETAVLIDPVDNTMFSPESDAYPSAAEALAALSPKKTAAVVGASVASTCNPQDANYATFYAQLGAGSWLEVQDGATHMDYVSPLKNLVEMPPVCGKGGMSPQRVQHLTAATTTAWLEHKLRGASADDFEAWIGTQEEAKLSVKA